MIHPSVNIILRKRDTAKSFRTQYQVQNKTQIRNQNVFKSDIDELTVKNYPENKQPIIHQQKFKPPICPSCKRNIWLEFDKGWICQICEYIINKQKHQIDKNVRKQNHYFSARLPYANKKIIEFWINMNNTTYNSTEDVISKLKEIKGKTKLKVHKNINKNYDEMNYKSFQFEKNRFAKNAQGISKIYQEVLLLVKILQTKPQVENMNIEYYDLYYTVIKNRNEKEVVNDENDYFTFNDFITPNHSIGLKPRETILKKRKKRSVLNDYEYR